MSQNQDQRVKKIEELGSNLGLKVLPKFKESPGHKLEKT
jgi:hypothetical protein